MKSFALVLLSSALFSSSLAFDLFGKKGGGLLPGGLLKGGLLKGKGGHHEACSIVEDDVWEEKCRTLFDNECQEDSVEQCKLVPQTQCKQVHEEQCSLVLKPKCKTIDVPKCNIIWEKKCVWERQCRLVPSPNPCHVSKKSKGYLPRLWKRSLDKIAHKVAGKKAEKLHKLGKNKGHGGYAAVPAKVHLEPEVCEPASEICDDVEKCKDYPNKQCSLEPKEKCVPLPQKECHVVPREHCQQLQVEVCRPVPRSTCRSVPRKECEKQLVKRPREVCIPPPVVTVKSEEAVW